MMKTSFKTTQNLIPGSNLIRKGYQLFMMHAVQAGFLHNELVLFKLGPKD